MIWIYGAIILLLLLLWRPYLKKKYKRHRWMHALNLKQHHRVFNDIYADVNGFTLSKSARAQHDAIELTYGEIEFTSFIALIAMTKPSTKSRFYDLGSGVGKPIMASAMVFDMASYCGIERLEPLHQAACLVTERLSTFPAYTEKVKKITWLNDDYAHIDLSAASLIFINATALFGEVWAHLNHQLQTQTSKGTIIITTSKPLLPSMPHRLIKSTVIHVSWGVINAYIQEKV